MSEINRLSFVYLNLVKMKPIEIPIKKSITTASKTKYI